MHRDALKLAACSLLLSCLLNRLALGVSQKVQWHWHCLPPSCLVHWMESNCPCVLAWWRTKGIRLCTPVCKVTLAPAHFCFLTSRKRCSNVIAQNLLAAASQSVEEARKREAVTGHHVSSND
jgi:hypothetical protein